MSQIILLLTHNQIQIKPMKSMTSDTNLGITTITKNKVLLVKRL